jgi:hypothetical protein
MPDWWSLTSLQKEKCQRKGPEIRRNDDDDDDDNDANNNSKNAWFESRQMYRMS